MCPFLTLLHFDISVNMQFKTMLEFIKGDILQILMSTILFFLWVFMFISSRDSLVLKHSAEEH